MEEFVETFDNFRNIYEKCSSLISSGIELETSNEVEVSKIQLKSVIKIIHGS